MKMKRTVLLVALICILPSAAAAATPAPALFFEDLQSGPNAGGESVSGYAGSYVTLYGNFFGATQGSSTVTLNGASCLRVVSWGSNYLWYQKLVVQLGPTCASGNFAVTVGGQSSNTLPFAVRTGNIYCVATSGSDSASGKFPSCWQSIPHAAGSIAAGDIAYVRNGVIAGADTGYGSPLDISGLNGTLASP